MHPAGVGVRHLPLHGTDPPGEAAAVIADDDEGSVGRHANAPRKDLAGQHWVLLDGLRLRLVVRSNAKGVDAFGAGGHHHYLLPGLPVDRAQVDAGDAGIVQVSAVDDRRGGVVKNPQMAGGSPEEQPAAFGHKTAFVQLDLVVAQTEQLLLCLLVHASEKQIEGNVVFLNQRLKWLVARRGISFYC